jgi:hypothetical protein
VRSDGKSSRTGGSGHRPKVSSSARYVPLDMLALRALKLMSLLTPLDKTCGSAISSFANRKRK